MSLKVSDKMRVFLAHLTMRIRAHLHMTVIEADITTVKTDVIGVKTDVIGVKTDVIGVKTDVIGVKTDVIGVKTDVIAIKDSLNDAAVNAATGQALLMNEQNHHTVILSEINNTVHQLITVIGGERRARKETEIQLVEEIAAMTNEMKKLAEIMDQHIRSTHQVHNK